MGTPEDPSSARLRPPWVRVSRALGVAAALVVGLLAGALVALQADPVGTWAARRAAGAFAPAGLDVTLGRVSGSWLRSLRVSDLRVESGAGEPAATVDLLRLDYRLWPLLRRHVDLRAVEVTGAELHLARNPDGSVGLIDTPPSPPADPTDPAEAAAPWTISVGRLDLVHLSGDLTTLLGSPADEEFPDDGAVSPASALPATPAVVFAWDDVDLHLRELRLGGGFYVTADSLSGRVDVPSLPAADVVGPVFVRAAGMLTPQRLVVDTVDARGPGSHLSGAGALGLPSASGEPAPVAFDLSVDGLPLALAHAALGNPPDDRARIDGSVKVTGTTRMPTAFIDLRVGEAKVAGSVALALGDDVGERYAVEVQVAALDPAVLTGNPVHAGRIDGGIDVALEGPSRRALSGHAHLMVDRLALAGAPLNSIQVTSEWTEGRAAVDLRAEGDVGALRLDGTARPLDPEPSWDLEGPVEAVFRDAAGPMGRARGRLSTRGEGVSLDSARIEAVLALSEVEVRGGRLDSVTLRGRLAGGAVAWTLEARNARAGVIMAEGSLDPTPPTAFRVDSGVVRDFDLAGWVGDSVESHLDARISASGEIGFPEGIEADLSASVRRTRYGALTLDSARLGARLTGGRVAGTLYARSPAGTADAAFTGRPFIDVPAIDFEHLDFADVDAAAFAAPPHGGSDTTAAPAVTRLTGRLSGTAQGRSAETLGLDLRLHLDTSRVNLQMVTGADGVLTLEGGEARVRLDVALADSGRLAIELEGRPFADRPTVRIDRLDFAEIDPFDLVTATPGGSASARLRGRATGTVTGFDPLTLAADLAVRLGPSRFNRARIDSAAIDVLALNGHLDATADVALASGGATVRASADLAADSTAYAVEAHLRSSAPGRFLAAGDEVGRLDATLAIEGRGVDPGTMEARLRLTADGTALGEVEADTVRVDVRLRNGVAHLDTLTVRSNVLDLRGGGTLAFVADGTRSDLKVEAVVASLAPLHPWVAISPLGLGAGRVDMAVAGPADALRINAGLQASGALMGTTALAGLSATFEGRLGADRTLVGGDGQVELDRLTIGGIDVRVSRAEGSWDGAELAVTGEATIDDRREARFAMRTDPRASARRASLDRLELRVDDDRWSLLGAPIIDWGEGLSVGGFDLRADDQAIFVDGRFDPAGESDMQARIEALRLGGLTDLLGLDRLDGRLTAGLSIDGPGTDPRIQADVSADLRAGSGARSTVSGTLSYDTLRLGLDGAIRAEGGGSITVSGGLPMVLSLTTGAEGDTTPRVGTARGEVDLAVRADEFAVHWAEPFLDPATARDLFGRLNVDARVTGTQASPVLLGSARLRDGRVTLPALGVTYERARADVTLAGGIARLDSASMATGDGVLRLDGTVALPELSLGEFDIRARLDRFRAVHNNAFNVRLSGALELGGTTAEPRVEGDVRLVEADVYLDDFVASGASVRPVELTEAQLRELEDYLGFPVRRAERDPGALFEALTLDVSVSASRDTWVRQRANPELEIQLTGDVSVQKQPRDSLRFDGRIETVARRSWVEQFGRRFRIEEGIIDLRGTAGETRVDVRAAYEVPSTRDGSPEATITLDIEGTLESLSLTLGSEPAMENADIVSYLATGRPASSSLAFQQSGGEGGGLRGMGSEFALGQVTGLVEGLAAQGAGLDVVEIRTDGLRGATLIAGRFVTPEVYVGFKQPVGRDPDDPEAGNASDRTEVELEIQALRWLLLNMEASNSAISFLFRFRYAY